MVDLSDTTEHRTCNSIPSPPGNIASAPKHKDDRDCSSFTVHKKQKFKKMFWWLQDWEVWSQKILCISFLVIHHHVLASLHPSVGQSLCKSCNVRTYYTIFLSQTYYLEQLLTTTTPPINFPKLESIKFQISTLMAIITITHKNITTMKTIINKTNMALCSGKHSCLPRSLVKNSQLLLAI